MHTSLHASAVAPEPSLILTEVNDGIGTITLHHEAKRNALSERMVQEMIQALEQFKQAEVRVAILRAAPGVKVWSAGHDVTELPAGGHDPLSWPSFRKAPDGYH